MTYRWAGRDEWMLVQDAPGGKHVLIVQPLFAELNRCRRLIRDVMRGLAARGIASSLPDLSGTGESERALAECGWDDWIGALGAAAAGARVHVASFRGGALLDHAIEAASRWRLSPVGGASLLRDLARAEAIGRREAGASAETAGYRLSSDLVAHLEASEPVPESPLRTVRLEGDVESADAVLPGPSLWRRAEPGSSRALAEAIADDLVAWIGSCAA